jgi:hypothetical protein
MIVCRLVFRRKEEQEVPQEASHFLSGERKIGKRESHVEICGVLLDVVL